MSQDETSTLNFFGTYKIQNPANSAITSTGQHSEIGDISEEVQPESKWIKSFSINYKNPRYIKIMNIQHTLKYSFWQIIVKIV